MTSTALHEHAAQWFVRIELGTPDAADLEALEDWFARDPANRLHYAEVNAAWHATRSLDVERIARSARNAEAAHRSERRSLRAAWMAGAAAVPVLALLIAWAPLQLDRARSDFHTAVGEVREEILADGSRLTLDTDSAVSVDYAGGERRITLLRGAARFAVERDPTRPFVVVADGVSATAVGTMYAVARDGDAVTVDVSEGIVDVATDADTPVARLTAGQGWRRDGGTHAATPADWAGGSLVFDGVPLGDVLARLDRYMPERLVLTGTVDHTVSVTAVVPVAEARAGVADLARLHGLELTRIPGLVVVLH
jgi:transmembrane sensor